MEWITSVAVPIVLGLVSAFGATVYANKKAVQRESRVSDETAKHAVRAYIKSLRDHADYLEARQMSYGDYDATREVINHSSLDEIRASYGAAAPYFHRITVLPDDHHPLSNAFPDYGTHPVEGADNFAARANAIQKVLDRGLRKG